MPTLTNEETSALNRLMAKPVLTDEEADILDELLTKTTVETNPAMQGPFMKNFGRMITVDEFSAKYITSKALATRQTTEEVIRAMVHRELAAVAE